ncbi:class I SAM-dependent methyltransferase [Marininema halotolerans]|uniref:Methyltransferase domain-containing protein n=1 Tax=Marininema halotolerans TaxID=1155944 RepID=A0A1I6TUE1_9BACL|nr:class I SAM-dependent methyltransferase [Marininema halotolerans]SFS92790.1 Methyltransferase domain-containing protein [Marininema halotolerans]
MHRFYDRIIMPIISSYKSEKIVEIGADLGYNTSKILEYCKDSGAQLTVIDPYPRFDEEELKEKHPYLSVKKTLSLNALGDIDDYDTILIDGDHNWYTVYHELKLIEQKSMKKGKFPLIFLHDTDWPYARRDMYYIPDSIPSKYRHSYAKKGLVPGSLSLSDDSTINPWFNHALYEGGKRNGVLTAVEDFLEETPLPFFFHKAYSNNGLGIIIPEDQPLNKIVTRIVEESGL